MFFSDVCGETDRTNLSRAGCHLRAPRFGGQGSVRSTATRWLRIAQGAGQAGAANVVTGDRQWNCAVLHHALSAPLSPRSLAPPILPNRQLNHWHLTCHQFR